MKLSTYDVILSIINIESLKSIKNKIYSLKPYSKQDKKFISSLKERVNKSKIEFLYNTTTSEIITLYHNTNIEQMPSININQIKFNDENLNSSLTNVVAVYTRKILDILSDIEFIYNNPDDVFYYLSLITRIEILISFMDHNMLEIVSRYCHIINSNKNSVSINKVKQLLKEKLEDNPPK